MPDKGLIRTEEALTQSRDRFPECVGRIAYSVAGRDRKRAFVIVGVCEECGSGMVYIADGRLRKLGSPKRKNLRHLRICGESVDLRGADDEKLREYLKSY